MYLAYKTDTWHSYNSRELIGASINPLKAIEICCAKAITEGEELTDEQVTLLKNINQTQGYSGEGEFQFIRIELDVLL